MAIGVHESDESAGACGDVVADKIAEQPGRISENFSGFHFEKQW